MNKFRFAWALVITIAVLGFWGTVLATQGVMVSFAAVILLAVVADVIGRKAHKSA